MHSSLKIIKTLLYYLIILRLVHLFGFLFIVVIADARNLEPETNVAVVRKKKSLVFEAFDLMGVTN
jgi:hypothetical protein